MAQQISFHNLKKRKDETALATRREQKEKLTVQTGRQTDRKEERQRYKAEERIVFYEVLSAG